MFNKKENKSKSVVKPGIIYATIFVIMNVFGIGYASLVSNTGIKTIISTGDIAPIFSSEPIISELNTSSKPDCAAPASAILSPDKKTMYISLPGAYPGYSVSIDYTVSNMGTIPVSCNISGEAPEPIVLDLPNTDGMLSPYGGNESGRIKISIPKGIAKKANYNFAIALQFNQYNLQN